MVGSGRKGFTLVELAVSMVVIGILLGLGMSMVGPLMTSIKVRESRENLAASVESINSYASGNNRLPDTTLLASVVRSPQDAWGRDFIYLYDANLYAASPTKDTVCGRRSTNITLTTTDPAATIPNVAYIMLSQGDNAVTDTTIGGTAVTTGAQTATVTVAANTADDLVRWVTLDELRTKIGCQGSQLKIVNNELPYGYKNAAYSAIVYADGGAPFSTGGNYKWCIKSGLPTGFTNPTNGCAATASCASLGSEATSEWLQATSLTINGTPTAEGSYNFTVYVRDNNDNNPSANIDNCFEKNFVITINPQ